MIRAKVAKIIDARTIVLNKGSTDGVEVGMRFAVLNRNGAEIKDPDTGEVLGSVDVEKTVVKISDVQERVSVGRTYRRTRASGFAALTSLSKESRVETLKTDEATYKQEMDERESYVKVGDEAIQVSGDEYASQVD